MYEVVHAPSQDEWQVLRQQAEVISASGLAPAALRNKPEAILTIALKGRELGVPPMQALSHIHVIQGRPTLSAELMRSLVLRSGHRIWVDPSSDDKRATVKGQRWDRHLNKYDELVAEASYSIEEAKQAGLTNKDNWKKFTKAMLVARATSILVREHFADVAMGASYTPEELDPDLAVDEYGAVVEADAPAPDAAALPTFAGHGHPAQGPDPSGPDTASSSVVTEAPTKAQYAKAHALLTENSIDEELYRAAMRRLYDVHSFKELTKNQMTKLIDRLESKDGIEAFARAGLQQLEDDVVDTTNIPDGPES